MGRVDTKNFIKNAIKPSGPMGKKPAKAGGKDDGSRAFGPMFNKDLGQHILKNPSIAAGIVDKAGVKPTDTVLEIGPGTGNLTVRILEAAKKVICIEADTRMAGELQKRVQGTPEGRKLTVTVGDACSIEYPYFDVCISNTPYQISSPLMFRLLAHRPLFRCAVLMFQKEFAARLLARPNTEAYSRLAVNVGLYARVALVMNVDRGNFRPPPQVDSTVVRIEPINPPPPVSFHEFDGMVRILFLRKNRVLRANFGCTSVLKMMVENYKTYCALKNLPCDITSNSSMEDGKPTNQNEAMKIKINEILLKENLLEVRPMSMDVNDFLRLLVAFHEANIHFA